MLTALVVAHLVLAASGDPYAQWFTDPTALSSGQKSTLSTQVLSRAPGVDIAELMKIECRRDNGSACCTPFTNDPQTGSAIRALLIAGVTWSPGEESWTQLKEWPSFCITGSALSAFATFLGNITPEASGNPIIGAVFQRTPGTTDVYLTTEYKRPMSAADCATYADRTLVPMGIVP